MTLRLTLILLVSGLLAGCATHQLTETPLTPNSATPFQVMQVQVNFATPAHSDYLADQLVKQLASHGVNATTLTVADPNSALLQVTLTDTWTETFISHRIKHRRSLTQMRGRIPRESPRFSSEIRLQDLATGKTVWQLEIVTAGPWYSDFNTNARSLAARLTRQLQQQGLIAPG